VKTSQTDTNAARSIALDHLGVIAARIRSCMLKFKIGGDNSEAIRPMDEVGQIFHETKMLLTLL
jgi:cohesin loading factor subunit SCC2